MSSGILPLVVNDTSSYYENLPLVGSFNRFQALSYAECEHLWSYGGKLVLLTRHLLNAAARSSCIIFLAGGNFSRRVKDVVKHLKLLSIVGVPFSLVDVGSILQKMTKSFLINDREGFAMSTLSLTMTVADVFDSTSTFVNALMILLVKQSSEILSSIGLPAAFVMSTVGTVSRMIQIVKVSHLYYRIHLSQFFDVKYENRAIFKKELEEILGVDQDQKQIELLSLGETNQKVLEELERLKEKKKAAILRLIPKNAEEPFKKLLGLLETEKEKLLTKKQFEEALECLSHIQLHLEKKIRVDVIGILANLFVISALILFSLGSMGSLPFCLLSIAFIIRIMSLAYQDCEIQLTNN